jgi:hypothetical protein
MTVRETHDVAVSNGKDTNYYRLRVAANTFLLSRHRPHAVRITTSREGSAD